MSEGIEGADDECLHCQVMDLIEAHVQAGETDIGELASLVAESLAEIVLMAEPADQPKLMADVIRAFGHAYLVKSESIPAGTTGPAH